MSLDDKVDLIESYVRRILSLLANGAKAEVFDAMLSQFTEEMYDVEAETDWEPIECVPVAWMVCGYMGVPHSVYLCHEEAVARSEGDEIVPLYRLDEEMEDGCDDDD